MNEQQQSQDQSQNSSGVEAAPILMTVGAILLILGFVLCVATYNTEDWNLVPIFCGGVLVLPIGGVLFLIGLVKALHNEISRLSL